MQTPASTITTTGDLGGHKVKMEIDSSALAHIMSILTDLYSDPEAAVIREYSTNALDAHKEAGNTAPIEITTPNALSPFFIVKDYGVGLSVTDIENMYSKYGASSKRETNEQVGMLGLGAKSALTLVPAFHLISVKNGVQITVMISRASDGSGQMEIVDTRATDEPNGVEIKIPVPRSFSFAQKVTDFFRFWEDGTVLVDGKAPERISGRKVGTRFIVDKNLRRDYIVMGNVAYPCKENLYKEHYSSLGVVAFVNIGDVNFTPSREDLHYTPQTLQTIRTLQAEFAAALADSARKDVAEAESYADAWKRAQVWRTSFYNRLGAFVYKGVTVPSEIPFVLDPTSPYGNSTIQGKEVSIIGKARRSYTNWIRSVNPSMQDDYLFVTGFADSLKISAVQRERVEIYCNQKGWACTKVVIFKQDEIIKDQNALKFLSDIKIVPWSEIAKIKIQRAKGAGKVRTEKYDLFTGSWNYTPVSDFDTSEQIIYITPADGRTPNFLRAIFPNAQIVMLGMNRWEKFKRDWPTAEYYQTAITTKQKALSAQFTETDKILWNYSDGYSRRQFQHLDATQINDPDLKRFVEVLNGSVKLSPAAETLRGWPGGYRNVEIETPLNPLTKYPMSGMITSVSAEHAHWYLNNWYAHLTSSEENGNIDA